MSKFKVGDLVMIKQVYRDCEGDEKPKLITAVYEDDDGFLWYKLHAGAIHSVEFHWAQEFEIDMATRDIL